MILPVLILLTYLPSFKLLAYSAYVGAVFLAVAMVVSFCSYIFVHAVRVTSASPPPPPPPPLPPLRPLHFRRSISMDSVTLLRDWFLDPLSTCLRLLRE